MILTITAMVLIGASSFSLGRAVGRRKARPATASRVWKISGNMLPDPEDPSWTPFEDRSGKGLEINGVMRVMQLKEYPRTKAIEIAGVRIDNLTAEQYVLAVCGAFARRKALAAMPE